VVHYDRMERHLIADMAVPVNPPGTQSGTFTEYFGQIVRFRHPQVSKTISSNWTAVLALRHGIRTSDPCRLLTSDFLDKEAMDTVKIKFVI
jgi:hypothetical protein